jgi:hypothetical protein
MDPEKGRGAVLASFNILFSITRETMLDKIMFSARKPFFHLPLGTPLPRGYIIV